MYSSGFNEVLYGRRKSLNGIGIVSLPFRRTWRFLKDFDVQILPLSAEIGSRAMSLVEQYALSHNMRSGDALIAATAIESAQPLCTANIKHYRHIPLLETVRLLP